MWSTWVRPLHAETISLRVAQHREGLLQLTGLRGLGLDELRAETDDSLHLCLPVRGVDVEVDRKLDRRRLRHALKEQLRPVASREAVGIDRHDLIAEDGCPELADDTCVLAGECDAPESQHAAILKPRARASQDNGVVRQCWRM